MSSFTIAYYCRKLCFGGEKCDFLIFNDFFLLPLMKNWRSGSICHDPKEIEITHQQASITQEQSFGAVPAA